MRTILIGILMSAAASANVVGTMTIDTSGLIGSPSGPFTLDFQLVGFTPNNNEVLLSNFLFGGGSLLPAPTSSLGGIAVQTSPFAVELSDSSFLSDVQFAFTPGSTLGFDINATTNDDPAGPDTFTFAILDSNGVELPTTNSFFDVFAELDLPSQGSGPAMTTSGTDSNRTTVQVTAPTFQSATPEPSTFFLGGILLAVGLAMRRRRVAR